MASIIDPQYQTGKWVSSMNKLFKTPEIVLDPKKTGLLIIDMQKGLCLPEATHLQKQKEAIPEFYNFYMDRLAFITLNIKRLLTFFRENKMEIIQTVVSWQTNDGRDRIPSYHYVTIDLPPNNWRTEVIDELKPEPGEVLFKKTTSGMFVHNGQLYQVIRNMGIEQLVITGIVTNGCINANVREAADFLGMYKNMLIEDCCTTSMGDQLHVEVMRMLNVAYAPLTSTEYVLNHLKDQLEAAQTLPAKTGIN